MTHSKIKTLLARQGIYDKKRAVCAYELLYRNGESSESNVDNHIEGAGEAATSAVIAQLFANLDIDSILGDKPAFVNFTHNHLIKQIPSMLPKNRIIIEVLETVRIDKPLVDSLISLKNQGYKIALDDFIFREETKPLVEIADFIKIDVLHLTTQQIQDQLGTIQGFSGKFLAEKIEDVTQFNSCIELGFDFFQGFFLNKPDAHKGHALTENKVQLLKLLAELNNEDVQLQHIENIILQVPKLSYRILRLANSAMIYNGRKIETLLDAITLLGLVQIRNWLNLILLASIDDLAQDLMERTLIRAKMCEHLAHTLKIASPQQAYMVGMLSTLDEMLNEPLPDLLAKIQLSDQLNNALLDHSGELGQILQLTIDYEEANFQQLEHSPIDGEDLMKSYLQGIEHTNKILTSIQ